MNLLRILTNLKYLLASRPYRLEKPVVLQLPVIDICNSHCQMCRIWENKKSDDVSVAQLRVGLQNHLFSDIAAVGINGGEPTLRNDLGELAAVLFDELPKLRTVSLITNGYNTDEVISRITDVGEVVQQRGGFLDVMVSLDGYGELHDQVRGKPGNFNRAQKVIDFACASPLVGSVRVGCTIIKSNVYGLHDLFEYCQQKNLYVKYRLGIPHQRLYTQSLLDPYALSFEEKYHIAEFLEGLVAYYEPSEQQRFFYRSLIDQILHNAPRKAGCDWQHRGATITSKGELLYCAVQSKTLGIIGRDNSEEVYFGNEAHLREIVAAKCDHCTHDYIGLPPRRQLIRQFALSVLTKTALLPSLRRSSLHIKLNRWREERAFEQRRHRYASVIGQPGSARENPAGTLKVLICGWYGTETLGDKGIIGGVIHSLREVLGDVHFTIVSLHPYVTRMTKRQMPELTDSHIVAPDEGVRLVATMDLVLFGGGPLMAILEIAEMEAIFSAARHYGIPTVVAGCGVGPLGERNINYGIRRLLELADLRIYRDEKSCRYAEQLGIDTRDDLVAEDPAFTWLCAVKPKILADRSLEKKVLLLGLRDFPYREYARHLSEAESLEAKVNYERQVVEALKVIAGRYPQLTIRPLPMCTNHFGSDDRWFYRRLFRNIDSLYARLDESLLGAELAPIDYCRAFLEANVALTMRFHSLVFALGLDLPAVSIDYTLGQGKVAALAERFAVPQVSLENVTAEFLVIEISRLLESPVSQANGFVPLFSNALRNRLPLLMKRSYHA